MKYVGYQIVFLSLASGVFISSAMHFFKASELAWDENYFYTLLFLLLFILSSGLLILIVKSRRGWILKNLAEMDFSCSSIGSDGIESVEALKKKYLYVRGQRDQERLNIQSLHKERQRDREFIAHLLNADNNPVCVLDGMGNIVEFNRACEKIFGYCRSECLGWTPVDFPFLQALYNISVRNWSTEIAAHSPILLKRQLKTDGITKQGRRFPCRVKITPAELSGERLYLVQVYLRHYVIVNKKSSFLVRNSIIDTRHIHR